MFLLSVLFRGRPLSSPPEGDVFTLGATSTDDDDYDEDDEEEKGQDGAHDDACDLTRVEEGFFYA